MLGAAPPVEPKEKFDVVPVAAAVVAAPNPNVPVLPPNGALAGGFVALPEPNVNGLAEAEAVGAVVVKLLPNENGVAVVVAAAAGFVDDPNENIFLKHSNLNLILKKRNDRNDYLVSEINYFISFVLGN